MIFRDSVKLGPLPGAPQVAMRLAARPTAAPAVTGRCRRPADPGATKTGSGDSGTPHLKRGALPIMARGFASALSTFPAVVRGVWCHRAA